MPKSYIQKRVLADGRLSISVRYSAPGPDATTILRGETVRQLPGETVQETERRARDLLAQRRTEIVQHRYVPPAEMTLADLIDRYLTARTGDLAASSIARYRRAVKLLPSRLHQTRIDRLGAIDLQTAYGRLLTAGHSASGVVEIHKVISGACRQAVAWGILVRSPATGVRLPTPAKPAPRVWSDAESARFLSQEGDHPRYGALWRLLLLTGMRIGEAIALTWGDVDLPRATVTIRRSMTDDAEGRQVVGTAAKTDRSRRSIALPPSCVAALTAHKARAEDRRATAVLFPNRAGGHLHDDTVRDAFRAAIVRAGVPEIAPHGLRHSNATNDLAAGTPAKVVADRLGISVKVLLETYGHALPGMHRAAADALDKRLTAEISPVISRDSEATTSPEKPTIKRVSARKTARSRHRDQKKTA